MTQLPRRRAVTLHRVPRKRYRPRLAENGVDTGHVTPDPPVIAITEPCASVSAVAETAVTAVLPPDDLLFRLMPDPLCLLRVEAGKGPVFLRANPAWERVLGYAPVERLFGTPVLELIHREDRPLLIAALPQHPGDLPRSVTCRVRRGEEGTEEFRYLDWSLSSPDSEGNIYAAARDVTDERLAEAEVRWQATHDPLTTLPNRNLLQDRLATATATAARQHSQIAVLFLDLDRFKPINDTLGHAAGDTLLREIADRLRGCLREEDTVARLGGDEFVVLLPRVAGSGDAIRVAEKISQRLAAPIRLKGHDVYVTASIGLSLFPEDGRTPEALIRSADMAMYRAKGEGRGRIAQHTAEDAVETLERLTLHSRLRQAVDRQEMLLHYQPQVSLHSGEVFGVEALLRWEHRDMGSVAPSKFIPLAEETGLIVPLGGWAVREACRQAAAWRQAGVPLRVSVNLSASQVRDSHLPDRMQRHLKEWNVAARHLDLELTESTFIHNDPDALQTLERLKEMGLRLSVDDFGTGYSSLSYLRRFPIDVVKVDRSFISNLDQSSADEAVVRAVIDLSHTLGMQVVAEGVETEAQFDKLCHLGCDAMQGFYFSAAVPPREISQMVGNSAANFGTEFLRNNALLPAPSYPSTLRSCSSKQIDSRM